MAEKQTCHICLEEVTDDEYRRELTCSYAACPSSGHAYHEDCIIKYLRSIKSRVDLLIGYQCPEVLDNGSRCGGRITGTHHRQPVNQKKKKKRVEAAAAAAAAAAKVKPSAAKAIEARQGVAAAIAAMRPAGTGAMRQATVSLKEIKPATNAVPAAGKVGMEAPGSGTAARLKGTPLAISKDSMMPDSLVRQRIIPGWTGPDKLTKVDRAKIAALQAEAKASASRSSKFQPNNGAVFANTNASAGLQVMSAKSDKEFGDMHAQHTYKYRQNVNDDYLSERLDTSLFARGNRIMAKGSDSGEDNDLSFEKPHTFILTQDDFPEIPAAAPAPVAAQQSTVAKMEAGFKSAISTSTSSSAVSMEAHFFANTNTANQNEQLEADGPEFPAAPYLDDKDSDQVMYYHELCPTVDEKWAVMDAYGNYVYVEDVYGSNPEVVESYDEATGGVKYYVLVRESVWKEMQAVAAAYCLSGGDGGGSYTVSYVPEASATAAAPAASLMPSHDDNDDDNNNIHQALSQPRHTDSAVLGRAFKSAASSTNNNFRNKPDANVPAFCGSIDDSTSMATKLEPGSSASVDKDPSGDDLDDLLALCLVSMPIAIENSQELGGKPLLPFSISSQPHDRGVSNGKMAFVNNPHSSAGYVADALTGTVDDTAAEDVDSLMQLLCV